MAKSPKKPAPALKPQARPRSFFGSGTTLITIVRTGRRARRIAVPL
jgi:hypothetical protein